MNLLMKSVKRLSRSNAVMLAAATSIAAVTYGAFVPLNYEPLTWDDTFRLAGEIPWLALGVNRRADWVANGVLFFPCGLLLTASLSLNGGPIVRGAAAIAAGTVLSGLAGAIEVAQYWFPGRTVSQNDILSEAVGAWIGALTWGCFAPDICKKLRALMDSRGEDLQVHLTQLYMAGLLIYGLVPFDLVLSASEFQAKFALERIVWGWTDVKAIAMSICIFVPVGIGIHLKRASSLRAYILAGGFAASYELLQLLVFTRTSAVAHGLAAFLGVVLGIEIAQKTRFWGALANRRISFWVPIVYLSLVTAMYWYPFDLRQASEWLEQFNRMNRVPFSSHYSGPEFQTLNNVVTRFIVFGSGGALIYFVGHMSFSKTILVVWAAFTELTQLFFESKIADPADAGIGVLAAFFGLFVAKMANQRLCEC